MFFTLSGFDSHPCSAKPGSPSMARSIFNFPKNTKTHTPAHGGCTAHNKIRDKEVFISLYWLSGKASMRWLREEIGCNASKA